MSKRVPIPADVARRVRKRFINCFYCGAIPTRRRRGWGSVRLEVDHIVPVHRGGTNDEGNLVMACEGCNRSKGAKTVLEFVNYCLTRHLYWRAGHGV